MALKCILRFVAEILADEDLIAQAQERERARLEEEARLLALQQSQIQAAPASPMLPPPPPVWAGSSEAAIDDFNAQPGAISAPASRGSVQYQQELARAAGGSGFIAPDVSPTGDVITPGYDPARDPRAIIARREAETLQRNQYIAGLVNDGATYAEALRAGLGRYPGTADPNLALKAEALALKSRPFTPRTVNVGGKTLIERSRNNFFEPRAEVPPKFMGGKLTPEVISTEKVLEQELGIKKRALEGGTKAAVDEDGKTVQVPLTETEKAEKKADIDRLEQQRRNLYGPGGKLTPEMNPNVDQPSWARMRDRFNAAGSQAPIPPQAIPVEETLTVTTKEQFDRLPSGATYTGKDGRKYRKP